MQAPTVESSSATQTVSSPKPLSKHHSRTPYTESDLQRVARAFEQVLPNLLICAREIENLKLALSDVMDRYTLLTQRLIRTDLRSQQLEALVNEHLHFHEAEAKEKLKKADTQDLSNKIGELTAKLGELTAHLSKLNT